MLSNDDSGKSGAANGDFTFCFTVFTPTFNRADTLPRVYESLSSQTFRDFEWLIIDDGSTDDTGELVARWQESANFSIRYLSQPNSGKHLAHNWAVEEALGELFLVLDSDDACVPEALERFMFHWKSISAAEQHAFSAVTALCKDPVGGVVGDPFPYDVLDSDSLELTYRYRVRGEKWGFHRTDVLRRFLFPLQPRLYIPECVVWNAIAPHYKTRYVNEILRIYFAGDSARDDQLTRLVPWGERAAGHVLQHETALNDEINWLKWHPSLFFRSAAHYTRFSFSSGQGITSQVRKLTNWRARALWLLMFPIGWLFHQIDLWRRARISHNRSRWEE